MNALRDKKFGSRGRCEAGDDARHRAAAAERLYLVMLSGMKTAISVPDQTFERVERRAHELGMSRSEFFTCAADRYLDKLDAESVTRQIDDALTCIDGGDGSWTSAVDAGRRVVADEGEW